jgi:hypothetical protein
VSDEMLSEKFREARASLAKLQEAIKRERRILQKLEAGELEEPGMSTLPGASLFALRATVEVRLLVQMRRQSVVGSAHPTEDEMHDGSDY